MTSEHTKGKQKIKFDAEESDIGTNQSKFSSLEQCSSSSTSHGQSTSSMMESIPDLGGLAARTDIFLWNGTIRGISTIETGDMVLGDDFTPIQVVSVDETEGALHEVPELGRNHKSLPDEHIGAVKYLCSVEQLLHLITFRRTFFDTQKPRPNDQFAESYRVRTTMLLKDKKVGKNLVPMVQFETKNLTGFGYVSLENARPTKPTNNSDHVGNQSMQLPPRQKRHPASDSNPNCSGLK
ncbi:unnamed protein product [Absidia cylindrospora]